MSDDQYQPPQVTVIEPRAPEPSPYEAAPYEAAYQPAAAPAPSPFAAAAPEYPSYEAAAATPPAPPELPGAAMETGPAIGKPKRSKKPLLIVLVVVILLGGAGAFFALSGGDAPSGAPNAAPLAVAPSPDGGLPPVAAPALPSADPAHDQKKTKCEDMLRQNAVKGGANADQYIAQNQAWVEQCIKAVK